MEEIVVNPHTGRWWTVGTHGAEFVDIPKNAIVFNHKQSKALLENGSIFGRGKALIGGTALAGGNAAADKATIDANKHHPRSDSESSNSSNKSSKTKTSTETKTNSSSEKTNFDWIEVAISRVKRSLENFTNIMDNSSLRLKKRFAATYKAIGETQREISVQQKAAARYLQEANSVKLSSDLKAKVRDGSISIGSYSEDTQKAIKEYQEAYEKFLDCSDAVKELNRSLADLFESYYKMKASVYDNTISKLDYKKDKAQARIDYREAKGKLANEDDYKQMITLENQRGYVLTKKRDRLSNLLKNAGNYGIEKGSDKWNDLNNELLDVNREIWQSNINTQELNNSLKQLAVDKFDKSASNYDDVLTKNSHQQNMVQSTIDLREAQGKTARKSDYDKLIQLEKKKQYVLEKKRTNLQNKLTQDIKAGIIQVGSEEYRNMTDTINGVNEELGESKVRIAELNNDIAQLSIDKFNNQVEKFDFQLAAYDHAKNTRQNIIDLREAQGKKVRISDYDALIKYENRRRNKLIEEVEVLKRSMDDARKAGASKTELQSMQQTINGVNESIQEADITLANLNTDKKQVKID